MLYDFYTVSCYTYVCLHEHEWCDSTAHWVHSAELIHCTIWGGKAFCSFPLQRDKRNTDYVKDQDIDWEALPDCWVSVICALLGMRVNRIQVGQLQQPIFAF